MNSLLIGLVIALALSALIYYAAKDGIEWQNEANNHLNNADHWHGLFYVNKDDNRIFLQKKRAGGYTINLGNPIGIVITLLFLGLLGWVLYVGA